MGTAPLSRPTAQPDAPTRPYARNAKAPGKGSDKKNSRHIPQLPRLSLLYRRPRREPRTLTQLILRQDWQKVLVRAKLFPHEIGQQISMQLYELPLVLLPLHLVCALDPPVAVVTLFLKICPEAATIPIQRHDEKPLTINPKSIRRQAILKKPMKLFSKYKALLSTASVTTGSSSITSARFMLFRGESAPQLTYKGLSFRRGRSQSRRYSTPEQAPKHTPHSVKNDVPEQSLLQEAPPSFNLQSSWRPYQYWEESGAAPSAFAWDKDEEDDDDDLLEGPVTLAREPSLMDSACGSSEASLSRQSSSNIYQDSGTGPKRVILQLSPSGGIKPLKISSQETTDGTTATSDKRLFTYEWDLRPLWESIMNTSSSSPDNSLLALHVATLYSASPSVIAQLVESHPMAAVSSVLGMLPIHMASAGWTLEPWVDPPPPPPKKSTKGGNDDDEGIGQTLYPYHHHQEHHHPSRVFETLRVLHQVVPESVRIKSGNHGMTPIEYVTEAMEDGSIKEECLALLEPPSQEQRDDGPIVLQPLGDFEHLDALASTSQSLLFIDTFDNGSHRDVPFEIHCSSDNSLAPKEGSSVSISSLLMSKDWEGALSLAEDDGQHAKQWYYGVDDHLDPTIDDLNLHPANPGSVVVWKRLALHLACRYRAPVGLVEVLMNAYEPALFLPDPDSGSLPIHLACHYKASFRVIKVLLDRGPSTTKAVDKRGRLPLHYAVLAKANYTVIELLIEVDPAAVLGADEDGKTPLDLARETATRESMFVIRLLELVTMVMKKPPSSTSTSSLPGKHGGRISSRLSF